MIRLNDGLRRLAGIGWLAATTGQPWLAAGCHWQLASVQGNTFDLLHFLFIPFTFSFHSAVALLVSNHLLFL
jgi:hypothetical protein